MQRLLQPRVGFALVAALYVFSFPYHPGLRSPNELCRLWQARALVEDGTVDINGPLQRYGYVGDLSVKDGKYYPSKAPLMSYLAAPIYAVLRAVYGHGLVPEVVQVFWSRLLLVVAPSLLLLVFLRRFLKVYLSEPLTDAVLLAYALGSMAFSYTELFMSHQVTAALAFFCFYVAWKILRKELGEKAWLACGALAGGIVVSEYTGVLSVLGVAAYVLLALWKDKPRLGKAVGLVIAGGAPLLALLMAYHQACFGHPLESGYKYLNDTAYQHWHVGGFLGIRFPDPKAFTHSFFSPLRGLFVLVPFLWVAFFGLGALKKKDPALFWSTLALLLGNAYFTSSFDHTSWGWTVGPRHLTPLLPFLMLPVGLGLEWLRTNATTVDRQLGLGLACGLCAVSVLATGWVVLVNYVPDSVSNALFAFAVPLFDQGYLPPTLLTVFGVQSLAPGALLLVLVAAGSIWVGLKLLAWAQATAAVRAGLVGGFLAVLLLLNGGARHDAADGGAIAHLKSVWLVQPPAQR